MVVRVWRPISLSNGPVRSSPSHRVGEVGAAGNFYRYLEASIGFDCPVLGRAG